MRSPVAIILALLCVHCAPALAQERIATAGRVVDATGDPVRGAVVTFAGDQAPFHRASNDPDVVTATTDARGRFRVELLRGHEYGAWASGPEALHGRRQVSALHEDLLPGQFHELPLVRWRSPARLRMRGDDAWRLVGPLRVRAGVDASSTFVTALANGGEPVTLPVLPDGRSWRVHVDDAAGRPLTTVVLPPAAGDVPLVVPQPHEVRVRVADGAGAPVAGATVAYDAGTGVGAPEWRDAVTTDERGEADVPLPVRRSEASRVCRLLATHDALGGDLQRLDVARAGDVTPFVLQAQWCGRLRDAGAPLGGATVHVSARHDGVPLELRALVDRDGHFVVRGLTAECTHVRALIEPPPDARRSAPIVLQPFRADQPFACDIVDLTPLRVRVVDAARAPARLAMLGLMPGPADDSDFDHEPLFVRTDALGTATVRVQRGAWYVFATDRAGFADAAIAAPALGAVDLRLVPMPVASGRVQLGTKVDARDVTLRVEDCKLAKRSEDPLVLGRQAIAPRVNRWLANGWSVAADGTFTLPFLDAKGATFNGRIDTPRGHAPFALGVAVDTPLELTLKH